jgi:hypothetical protein
MRIIRVFPRKTKATPVDRLAIINRFPILFDEADEIHISATFTWDIPRAEVLAKQWKSVAPVKIGGPAFGDVGGDFTTGMYIKKGYVMTSRGCPNSCWFCYTWKREGRTIRELPITEGYNLLDSNILACSDGHIKAVFSMLADGKKKFHSPVQFTGGLEAARLKQWHVDYLRKLRPKQLFFAYDTPDDLEPLVEAGKKLYAAGFTNSSHGIKAYVLCGYENDTFQKAEKRLLEAYSAGFIPMAMVFRDSKKPRNKEWQQWARTWLRPEILFSKLKVIERGK